MALATLAQIRSGLNTRLATISGLQTYAYMPAVPACPCAFVAGVGESEYHRAHQTGYIVWPCRVVVLVSTAPPNNESQTDLDEFISPTGTNSVRLAIEGTSPPQQLAGSIVADVMVRSTSGHAAINVGGVDYWGAEFTVDVHAGV